MIKDATVSFTPVLRPTVLNRDNTAAGRYGQITQRYLGSRQNLKEAVNDRLGLDRKLMQVQTRKSEGFEPKGDATHLRKHRRLFGEAQLRTTPEPDRTSRGGYAT